MNHLNSLKIEGECFETHGVGAADREEDQSDQRVPVNGEHREDAERYETHPA